MLSSRAKIHRNAARLPHLHNLLRHHSAGTASTLTANFRAGYATADAAQERDSIKHLIKGPMTPLTIFATSPPPPPHPSTYLVPASAADGAALDFRLSFVFPQVQTIKEERFKEEMGVFKILYERPFLREYKNIMTEKGQTALDQRRAARKAERENRKRSLRKRSLFQLEQDRQRKVYLHTLRYPFQLPDITVKGEELKQYFNFIDTHSEKDIYDRLYPEFFGDTRERVEKLVPHKHDGYVWDTFFDPENPSEFPNHEEAEGDIWEMLNKTAEQQLSDLADEMEGEQEREARLANWENDPARFKGKWTPRSWPKEELELSHIKQRARNLRYLREQLKKHGLLPEEDAAKRDALQQLEGGEATQASLGAGDDWFALEQQQQQQQGKTGEEVVLRFDTEAAGATAAAASDVPAAGSDINALLDAVLPTEERASTQQQSQSQSQQQVEPDAAEAEEREWQAKVSQLQDMVRKREREGATEEELEDMIIEFIGEAQGPEGDDELQEQEEQEQQTALAELDAESETLGEEEDDWEKKAMEQTDDLENRLNLVVGDEAAPGLFLGEGGRAVDREEIMKEARERVARLHRLQEHVAVPYDDSLRKQIFANEPIPGEPAVEFIHSYSMDPDVAMGSLGRREFLQRKVVMKVHLPSLRLPSAVQQRLIALVGPRYDARSGWLKLVGDKHPNRHLNQKYLKLLMRELLNESYLADSRYTPLSDLNIQDPSSLRRKYSLSPELQSIFDGKTTAGQKGWEYKMFKFGRLDGRYPSPQEVAERTAGLKQRLSSALSS